MLLTLWQSFFRCMWVPGSVHGRHLFYDKLHYRGCAVMFQDGKPVDRGTVYFGTETPQLPEVTGSWDQVWQQVCIYLLFFEQVSDTKQLSFHKMILMYCWRLFLHPYLQQTFGIHVRLTKASIKKCCHKYELTVVLMPLFGTKVCTKFSLSLRGEGLIQNSILIGWFHVEWPTYRKYCSLIYLAN